MVVAEGGVLFIRRTRRLSDPWSGDMAFPGGFRADADTDPLETARRESAEEVGLALPMPDRRLPALWAFHPGQRRPARIVPYVFLLDERPAITLEPSEVDATFWVPLSHLAADRRRRWIRIRGVLPWPAVVRTWEGQRIWGLTGRMVDDLLLALGVAAHVAGASGARTR